MASLKTLRNRIASVKATQKITKAMQMVAASKLRRAQAAAEAARPYASAHGGGARQPRQYARRRAPTRRRCSPAPGSDQTHLLVVCTADRGLCGAFNSSIARLARDHALRLMARGQGGQDSSASAARASTSSAASSPKQIIEVVELRARQADRLRRRRRDRAEGARALRRGRLRRLHAVLCRVQVGDLADPDDRAQLIPARDHRAGASAVRRRRRHLRIRAGRGDRSSPTFCRATSRSRSSGRFSRTSPRSMGAKMSAMDNATRNAGDMIDRYTLNYNRTARRRSPRN